MCFCAPHFPWRFSSHTHAHTHMHTRTHANTCTPTFPPHFHPPTHTFTLSARLSTAARLTPSDAPLVPTPLGPVNEPVSASASNASPCSPSLPPWPRRRTLPYNFPSVPPVLSCVPVAQHPWIARDVRRRCPSARVAARRLCHCPPSPLCASPLLGHNHGLQRSQPGESTATLFSLRTARPRTCRRSPHLAFAF